MTSRQVGLATMFLGGLLIVVGAVGMLRAEDGEAVAASTTVVPSSTAASQTTVTTSAPSTTTTTALVTTTSAPSTTTTVLDAATLIEEFVADFVGWISADDVDTLTARLHPTVIEQDGEDLCRSFVEREILELVDYRLDGPVSGPNSVLHGSAAVDVFDAPVAFTFQGEEFTGTAGFAIIDGIVHWFATCR